VRTWRDLIPITSFNLLDGKIYEPKFGGGNRANILKASRAYPNLLAVRTGASTLSLDSEAAGAYSEQLSKIFSIKSTEVVLDYYLRNFAKQTFGAGKFSQR
jgi:hypothetical protein